MTEDEFLDRWSREQPMYEAWGQFVANCLREELRPLVAPVSTDIFVRIPVMPRLKSDGSIVTKAFYRDKNYADPFRDITDKVGLRFVVLLASQIPTVCRAVEGCGSWDWSKDRDYEQEIANTPYEFRYQSVHYILRTRTETTFNGVHIEAGTPCEVQIRTLLQHAHSELTHDTIYKPSVTQTPEMLRAAAKSMALIEATNDYFEELVSTISQIAAGNRKLSDELADVYRELVHREPETTRADGLLNEAFATFAGADPIGVVRALAAAKPYVPERIAERATTKLLFRQPSILLAYAAVAQNPTDTPRSWPLTPGELKPLFSDLGIAWTTN
jgi:putative GTP pyrophosphokinase